MKLSEIVIDSRLQMRQDGVILDAVEDYSRALKLGESFPPITVFEVGPEFFLVDGFHRYAAHRKTERETIDVEIIKGSWDEAVYYARYVANRKNGMKVTLADKKNILSETLKDPRYFDTTVREIADLCGLSVGMVQKYKSSLTAPPKPASFTRKSVSQMMELLRTEKKSIPSPLLKVLERGFRNAFLEENKTPLSYHDSTGFVYPSESGSEGAIKEAYLLKDYGGLPTNIPFRGATVMDCGGHIGCFSRRAAEEGAKQITLYEPFPACFESASINLEGKPVDLVNAAVSTRENSGQDMPFFFRDSRLEASSLVRKSEAAMKNYDYQEMRVPCISFWDEIDRVRPSIVKMDIEGAEWEILKESTFPDFVKVFMIEVHHIYSKGVEAARELVESSFTNSSLTHKHELLVFNRPNPLNVQLIYTRK